MHLCPTPIHVVSQVEFLVLTLRGASSWKISLSLCLSDLCRLKEQEKIPGDMGMAMWKVSTQSRESF